MRGRRKEGRKEGRKERRKERKKKRKKEREKERKKHELCMIFDFTNSVITKFLFSKKQ